MQSNQIALYNKDCVALKRKLYQKIGRKSIDGDKLCGTFFGKYKHVTQESDKFFPPVETGNKTYSVQSSSLHDCKILNLTEQKQLNHYKTNFDLCVLLYDEGFAGTVMFSFEIEGKEKLRQLNNKTIDHFNISEKDKTVGVVYEGQDSIHNFVFHYDKIKMSYGNIEFENQD